MLKNLRFVGCQTLVFFIENYTIHPVSLLTEVFLLALGVSRVVFWDRVNDRTGEPVRRRAHPREIHPQ